MRKWSIVSGVVGIVLIVGALITAYVVAPAVVKLPGNTNISRTYAGTAASLLNPAAIASGNVNQALLHNVPIVATHKTDVLDTTSSNAKIADTKTLSAAGQQLSSSTFNYAVNRKNMGRGSGFSDVTKQTGITFNFPIHTQKHNYAGWVSDTGQSTTLRYAGTSTRGGQHVYVFTTATQAAPITDPNQLRTLPPALPKSVIPALAAANGISASTLQAAAPLLAGLPANVPLAYTYQVTGAYYVSPTSGVVVDINQHEVRSVGVAGASALPTFPIADLTFTSTPASLQAAAKDASDKGGSINLIESTLPWTLGIAGGVLVLVAIALYFMAGRREPAVVGAPTEIDVTDKKIPEPRRSAADEPADTEQP
jgi:hypothetical protein